MSCSFCLQVGRRLIAVLGVIGCVLAGGCAGGRPVQPEDRTYTFVYLKTGPKSAGLTPEQRQEVFKGHMSNMQRLADEGKLLIAGPFAKPRDPAWRGLFVYATGDAAEARLLTETDPGMIAGVFVAEVHPMRGPKVIADAPAMERAMQEEAKQPRVEGEPPPLLRGYAMITAEDGERASRALAESADRGGLGGKVLWSGRFTDTGTGVYVMDAADGAALNAMLDAEAGLREAIGACGVDGWYSTKSLERLGGGR